MGVPVRWLLDRPELGLAVLAGADALDRPITWAHSIELADPVPWLRGGELLLTTGLRLPTDPEGQGVYARSLHGVGVAAIGFGVGLSHQRVPRPLMSAADELGLPLLEVPLPTPFVAVVRAVTERLAQQQYEGFVRASRVQPRMTRAAVRGGAAAVVRELAKAVGGNALLLSPDGAVLAGYPPSAAGMAATAVARLGGLGGETAASTASVDPQGAVTAQVVRVGRRVHGHLLLVTEAGLGPADQLLLGHAVSLAGLEQEKPLRVREAQNRLTASVLRLTLDGGLSGPAAVEQLRAAGFPDSPRMAAVAIGGVAPSRVLAVADRVLAEQGVPCVGVERDGFALLLLPGEPAGLAESIIAEARGGRGRIRAGLARASPPVEIADVAARALSAARVAAARGTELFDAAGLAGQVLAGEPATRAVLAGLARARLGPLAEHDRRTGAELVASLRAFLEHHGQLEAASAELGVHRHTLRARIDRIRELLDVDLGSAHVRAELLLALVAWSDRR
ncbi:PucR family transcriptional regulator [Pseudonocardia asaccharolytica]|uniref:Putative regulatory protein n=1 Tax=Pseudonocardia asaccharolytica DSM 44247 = NBRC 16224 TaxID=1123024 RepID=A0A511CZ47_9PSEU|nr:PucR family transcriptional regulator [Pseudonocardia asaccharolytica]GEL17825.1 putative regulatory protein [Pseudonocardia asaccharolytica DSM 44247 = NBRC 16224]